MGVKDTQPNCEVATLQEADKKANKEGRWGQEHGLIFPELEIYAAERTACSWEYPLDAESNSCDLITSVCGTSQTVSSETKGEKRGRAVNRHMKKAWDNLLSSTVAQFNICSPGQVYGQDETGVTRETDQRERVMGAQKKEAHCQ